MNRQRRGWMLLFAAGVLAGLAWFMPLDRPPGYSPNSATVPNDAGPLTHPYFPPSFTPPSGASSWPTAALSAADPHDDTPEGSAVPRPGIPSMDHADAAQEPARSKSDEPVFAAFREWLEAYSGATTPESRSNLETVGLQLAQQRRTALADLIRTDPEHALEVAISRPQRASLPESVRRLVEQRVSNRGRLNTYAICPAPGEQHVGPHEVYRAFIGDQCYEACVYGRRLGGASRADIPLNGVALDDLLAVDENPLRVLPPIEAQALMDQAGQATCPVCQQPATIHGHPIVAETGGENLYLCSPEHAAAQNEQLVLAEAADEPTTPASMTSPATYWTLGEKRLLFIRVEFSDLLGTPLADGTWTNLVADLNSYYLELSYGLTWFAPGGAGSDLTPTFMMPQTAAWYGANNAFVQLRNDARTAAAAAGYVLENYELDLICLGLVPGWDWAGKAGVGTAGAWLRNSFSTAVVAHELGHNYGLLHANFWNTQGQSVIGPGTSVEYGDAFDLMGAGYASGSRYHVNARYKNLLRWLTPFEVLTVRTSATYRIFPGDDPSATGFRGLKIPRKDPTTNVFAPFGYTNYWIDFRQQFTGNAWLMNGAGLRTIPDQNYSSLLLDATPGTSGGTTDSALLIGRTYSDPDIWAHITPVRKGGTSPESLEVVVNIGNFITNNILPVVTVAGTANAVLPSEVVTFTATASDANGDELAYAWEFGDGAFGTNGPVASQAWTSPGDYVVRCRVSDMKGGHASDSVIITVGAPTTSRLSGRITEGGEPLENVRVHVSATRMAYTDSDGDYVLTGLAPGNYTVQAGLYGYTLTPGFANPVTVGPDRADLNFVAQATVVRKPWIVSQPESLTVAANADAVFNVVAYGTPPRTYQWWFANATLTGATGPSYTRTGAQLLDAGDYFVVVSNAAGTVTSVVAALTVVAPLQITAQPQSQTVNAGGAAVFSVEAAGPAAWSYQWRFNETNLLAGATNRSLVVSNVSDADAGAYSVVLNDETTVIESSNAWLIVNHLPVLPALQIERYALRGVKLRASDLLGTDLDGDPLTLHSVTPASAEGGTVVLQNGWVIYNPVPGNTNADSFGYVVSDGRGGFSAGTISVRVHDYPDLAFNLYAVWQADGSVKIFLNGIPGRTYEIQFTENLSPPDWQPLATIMADGFGIFEFADWPPPESTVRLYRAVNVP